MSSTQTTVKPVNNSVNYQIGQRIADLLWLKFDKGGLTATGWGNKSVEGLGVTIVTIVDQAVNYSSLNAELLEALNKVMSCIKSTSDLIKLGDSIYDIRYEIEAAIQKATH